MQRINVLISDQWEKSAFIEVIPIYASFVYGTESGGGFQFQLYTICNRIEERRFPGIQPISELERTKFIHRLSQNLPRTEKSHREREREPKRIIYIEKGGDVTKSVLSLGASSRISPPSDSVGVVLENGEEMGIWTKLGKGGWGKEW